MSILDDKKRAVKGAKTLLTLLTQTTAQSFEQDLENFAAADGIIGPNFLEDIEKAKAFLPKLDTGSDLDEFFEFPFEFQMAFLECFLQKEFHEPLPELLEKSQDKALKKQIARRIHELKSRGVIIKTEKKNRGVRLKPVEEPQPLSIVSESTGSGEREIFYTGKHQRSGIRILYFLESFYLGILDFQYFETSRSGYKDLVKKLKQEKQTATFEVDQSVGYYLLEQARNRNEVSGRPFPTRFLTILNEIPKSDVMFDRSPVWNNISSEQVDQTLLEVSHSAELHELPEFRNWYLPTELLQETEKQFSEIMHSTVLVDKGQKAEMIDRLVMETVDGYFDQPNREKWILRIEDAAYLLTLCDEAEKAVVALAVAKTLGQSGRPASSIPFCEQLLSKLIKRPSDMASEQEPKNETPQNNGGIILP